MVLRPLCEELQKVACEELFEQPERISAELEAIRNWLEEQPHLSARTDDQFLISFLRSTKYNLAKTKSKLQKFYEMRTKYPQRFRCTNADEPELRALLSEGVVLPLPTPLHNHGPRISIIRMGATPAGKYSVELLLRAMSAAQHLALLQDDNMIVQGYHFIMDLSGTSMAHFVQWTPGVIASCITYAQRALPFRQKALHFIHANAAVETLFRMIKFMFPKKQQKRYYMHATKLDNLYQIVPQKYLPQEYGGENSSIAEIVADMHKQLDEYRDDIREEANYGTNDNLRKT